MYSLKEESEQIKKLNKSLKKGRRGSIYGKSKLRPYRTEIFKLKDELGHSFYEIKLWLKTFKKIKGSRSCISNFYYREKEKNKGEL